MSQSCDDQIGRLVRPGKDPNRKPLGAARERARIGPSRSEGRESGTDSSTGAGIASPLTEKSRTYYDPQDLVSSDGLFTLTWTPVYKMNFEDDSGKPIELRLLEP